LLRVDPERRFFTPPLKARLGATEWVKSRSFLKELRGYTDLRNNRIGRLANHKWYITYWNHLNYACEKNYFDLLKNEYYI